MRAPGQDEHKQVQVGINTKDPRATLDVNGGLRLGDDTRACGGHHAQAGTYRYHNNQLEYCDGTNVWKPIIGAGADLYNYEGGAAVKKGRLKIFHSQ